MSTAEHRDQTPSREVTKAISELLESGRVGVVITVTSGLDSIGSKLLVDETGEVRGSLGNHVLDSLAASEASKFLQTREETRTIAVREFAPSFPAVENILLLFERIQTAPRLVICGAGHVGAALARLATLVGYQTTLIDDRADFVNPSRFQQEQIELIEATNWSDSVREAVGNGKGVAVAIVTRGHSQDEQCLHAVVGTKPDYVGLIGSKRRTTIVIDRLRQAGASEDQLAKIHAPIGLEIGAVSPEEVALAIIAEIVAERHGGKGGSLSAWRRKGAADG
jgi:xanthine dehydrogenase accessory factor